MAEFINKKILVINNIYPPQELGGYGRYISDFANILRGKGHEVKVLTSDAPYLQAINFPEPEVDRNLQMWGSYEKIPPLVIESKEEINRILAKNNNYIEKVIHDFQPDVALIGNINLLGYYIFEPFFQHNIPVINHLAFNQPDYPLASQPNNQLYHLSVCSNFVKNQVINLGYKFDDISVIYPGAYVEDFANPQPPEFDKLKIVFASILLPYKGPQTLVEALAIIHNEGFDFDCILAGTTPNQEFKTQLKNFIFDHQMQDKVKIVGYQSRETLIQIYKERNVFVFPSTWEEPFGISQVEGMAAGLTTITSATGGASEIVEHGLSGLKFEPKNPLSLAFCLLRLIANPDDWKQISQQGIKRAKELFDIYSSVDLLEDKFAELLLKRDDYDQWLQKQQEKISIELEPLQLREINYIIFPDWTQPEDKLGVELQQVIQTLATNPENEKITLIIYTGNTHTEDAEILLSGVSMNLLMEDVDISDTINISLVDNLEARQWEFLWSLKTAGITLECEDRKILSQLAVEKIPFYAINNLNENLSLPLDRINNIQSKIANLIDYNIKDITIKIPQDHALPIYQNKFRLYDKFIGILAKYLPNQEDLIIDIGANVGDTTALILQYCENPILSIEADEDFFNIMQLNLADYTQRVTCVNSFVSENENSYKNVELVKQNGTARAVVKTDKLTKSNSLKYILNSLKAEKCILLKTDTDGFDFEILLSSLNIIKENNPIIYWENEIVSLKDLELAQNLLKNLADMNYTKYIVIDNFGNPLTYDGSAQFIEHINEYLLNNIYSKNRTFYYTDIAAFPDKYSHLISSIASDYNDFIKSTNLYP
ncbi:FkbM family methyltransferase [Nodularia spumigena]|uniref:FkbM family methyltransferase n=1 Tax=Nodularia spumigena TaxID=70799 RepID=UPI000D2F97D6|nr:FkbM family methyltransferase [Nodularia spumigena]